MQGLELKKIIEAIIFISEKPVKLKQLTDLCRGVENSEIKNGIEVVRGDIRDYDSVYNAMENCKALFHLAAFWFLMAYLF